MEKESHKETLNSIWKTKKVTREDCIYWGFVISIYLLMFEEPVTRVGINLLTIYRNLIPIAGVLLFIDVLFKNRKLFVSQLLSPYFILGAVFIVSGIIGWIANRYQSFVVTAEAAYEHLRFWVCLYLFLYVADVLDIKKIAKKLFIHISVLSGIVIVLSAADYFFKIWPRQMYRYGTSSLQIFYGHPSNLGAHAVFLIGMLLLLIPYMLKGTDNSRMVLSLFGAELILLLAVVYLTLRVRLFGFIAGFVILFIYLIILRKKLKLPIILASAAGVLAVGYRRLYGFYFSGVAYHMARGRFAINSLDIARNNFPFGSGFGTFGSRMAQLYYSPLYYKYNMMTILGLSPSLPAYACDTFYPVILAESGWLGFVGFYGIVVILCIRILMLHLRASDTPEARYAVLTALLMMMFELLEGFATLSFSETYSVLITIPLAFSVAILKHHQCTKLHT